MSVVVIVEDGTGLSDANSYASVAEADAYFASRPRSTSWASLTVDAKGGYLVHATRYLDASVIWEGTRTESFQALEFPRAGIDMDLSVPTAIKIALYEIAYLMIGRDITAEPATSGFSKLVVGPIEVETSATSEPPVLPRFVRSLIAPFGQTRGGNATNVRLVRR